MILQIAVNAKRRQCFDYLPPPDTTEVDFKVGVRVRVPFRNKTTIGILIAVVSHSLVAPEKLKPAIAILDDEPLFSTEMFSLLQFASAYYQHPIGEVFSSALPALLRKGRLLKPMLSKDESIHPFIQAYKPLLLNAQQAQAVQTVSESLHQFGVYLLNGVTGSGKTEVYWHLIEQTLAQKKQVLLLVPEIGLTPQLSQRLQAKLAVPIVIMHSHLTEKERFEAWLAAKKGAPVIMGTRSAVFTPLPHPGLIIIDEEHDVSFKQQDGFRYSARDMAIVRARKENIPIVLGSATPSLESLNNVKKNRYVPLYLPERAGNALLPQVHLVDVRAKNVKHEISSALLTAIESHLAANQQILLFINRRGYAPVLLCPACGWMAVCPRCDARLTVHQSSHTLLCHHCEFSKKIDVVCPSCQNDALSHLGLGTQKIESILAKHFPHTPLNRIDKDSTRRKGELATALEQAHGGHSQILIGTQMLAKGHHFPNVTLVGVLDVDGGFFSSDFRATERMAQLLVQVAGRAGREQQRGEVYLQTHHPEHPLLLKLLREGYDAFAQTLLTDRNLAELPPFAHLALFRAESVNASEPRQFLQHLATKAKRLGNQTLSVLGPLPAPMEKKAGRYRAQLVLRSHQRSLLNQSLSQLLNEIDSMKITRRVRWSLDVDPLEMF